ncbi:hypothetical protein BKA62DRAFT_707860 [Auriculariales sp. MPI-PUGE-AT-0066]|nr:hypothetical protein BKA62DRAFT_707860 [Auriculariales sp. MPI-PUGE-AT-0066]
MASSSPFLLSLDDDLIYLVCVALRKPPFQGAQRPWNQSPRRQPTDLELFSVTCKRVREVALPVVFAWLRVSCGWSKAAVELQQLACHKHITRHTRELTFVASVDASDKNCGMVVTHAQVREVTAQLLAVLEQLSARLTRLVVDFDSNQIHSSSQDSAISQLQSVFATATSNDAPSMQFVKELETDTITWAPLMKMCPGATGLVVDLMQFARGDHNSGVVDSSSLHRGLQRLAVRGSGMHTFKQISTAAAGITELKLDFRWDFKEWTLLLEPFKQLQTLILPDADTLDLGFEWPECGNFYYGMTSEDMRRFEESQEKDKRRAIAQAKEMVCPFLPNLGLLVIGKDIVEIPSRKPPV